MRQDACILAIDCATGPVSVAVWKDGRIAALAVDERPVVQSARLMPLVEHALAEAGITYHNLTHVACTVGPGSFTGIRVGLAAARGICFAAGIEGIGYTTLEVLAHAMRKRSGSIFAILNAGKGEWYYQAFVASPWQACAEPGLASPELAARAAPEGALWVGNVDINNIIAAAPRADALAELAASGAPPLPLAPFYIRPPDATFAKAKS